MLGAQDRSTVANATNPKKTSRNSVNQKRRHKCNAQEQIANTTDKENDDYAMAYVIEQANIKSLRMRWFLKFKIGTTKFKRLTINQREIPSKTGKN